MQIVIDIPDKVYGSIFHYDTIHDYFIDIVARGIINGIVLPKGHGRLIDADSLKADLEIYRNDWDAHRDEYESCKYKTYAVSMDAVDNADTIIEANKEDNNAGSD